MRRVNVEGTTNVIAKCREHNIKCLVYTSSLEVHAMPLTYHASSVTPLVQVVCGDGIEFKAGDESAKIPARHYLPYATSKTEAEAAVLAASSPTLQTVAIRSGYIFGKNCIGVALELKTSFQRHGHYVTAMVPAKISCVNPSNCARAHILAWERRALVGGKAYFIRDFDANVVDMNIRSSA